MLNLQITQQLNSPTRISSVDIFRGVAILLVLLFHFNEIVPFGYIGVDLFFVISGLLVGGILVKQTDEHKKTKYFKFVLQRGFKIWPSYYIFILLNHLVLEKDFSFDSLGKYLFFYQNYTGESSHLWSLCVEEHFYLFLPLIFIIIQKFKPEKQNQLMLFAAFSLIAGGILFKFASYYLTNSQDTFSATHNRIDGLAWGFLLSQQVRNPSELKKSLLTFMAGLLLLISVLLVAEQSTFFHKTMLHSFIPFAFYLMVKGLYTVDFSKIKSLRIIAYFSYNIFLWHNLVGILLMNYFGASVFSFLLYLLISFFLGVIMTILVEERFLKWRRNIIG